MAHLFISKHVAIPLEVLWKDFQNHGYSLNMVGGVVRDLLMNKTPKDIDLSTEAEPDQIKMIMQKLGAQIIDKKGGNYGTVHCIYKGESLEITTYRANESYERGNRRPVVNFSRNVEDDLVRRDFACNAVRADLVSLRPAPHGDFWVVDLDTVSPTSQEGIACIRQGLISTPINASTSFSDDPLRILRAIRFKHTLEFEYETDIRPAIRQWAPYLKEISWERIHDELVKIAGTKTAALAFREMMEDGVLTYILPEVVCQLGYDQDNRHHHLPLWEHTLLAVDYAAQADLGYVSVLGLLLHDVSKPTSTQRVFECVACEKRTRVWADKPVVCEHCEETNLTYLWRSFIGHDTQGAEVAERILRRIKFSLEDIEAIAKMIAGHIKYSWQERPTDTQLRRFVNDMGPLWETMIPFMVCDKLAHHPDHRDVTHLEQAATRIQQMDVTSLIKVKSFVSGHEIMEMFKLKPGPLVGQYTKPLIQAQIDGTVTSREEALTFLQELQVAP